MRVPPDTSAPTPPIQSGIRFRPSVPSTHKPPANMTGPATTHNTLYAAKAALIDDHLRRLWYPAAASRYPKRSIKTARIIVPAVRPNFGVAGNISVAFVHNFTPARGAIQAASLYTTHRGKCASEWRPGAGLGVGAGCYGKHMGAALTTVPVEEYLRTTYHPDCEYVDGQLVERNVGEYYHSLMETLVAEALSSRERGRR